MANYDAPPHPPSIPTSGLSSPSHAHLPPPNDAEQSFSHQDITISRLKNFALEAVRQRDDAVRLKYEAENSRRAIEMKLQEALRRSNDALKERDDAIRERDDALSQRDEVVKSLEDAFFHKEMAMIARNASRSDIEAATRLLVAGADFITAKVSSIKHFPNALPRSASHTGFSAVVYGFTKRSEEIVNELLHQHDAVDKERSGLMERMERQHRQAVIKISELESTIDILEDNLSKKTLEIENCKDVIADKEIKISDLEQIVADKVTEVDKETFRLTNESNLMQSKIGRIKSCTNELSELTSKLYGTIASHAAAYFHASSHPVVDSSAGEPEECLCDCTDRLRETLKIFSRLAATWEEQIELRKKALEDTEGTITRLIVEKKEITNFLGSALAVKQELLEAVSRLSLDCERNLNTTTKSRDASKEANSLNSCVIRTESSLNEELMMQASSRVAALEDTLKKSRQEIFELQRSLADARADVEWLRLKLDRQTKELVEKTSIIQDLETKQLLAKETLDSVKHDLMEAKEDILHWKQVAAKEVDSRGFLLKECEKFQEHIFVLKEQIQHLNNSLEDSRSKLRTKEEMAAAAIAARNAAERSLQIADNRAVELRKKIEDMSMQFEIFDVTDDVIAPMRWLDSCWPYKWSSAFRTKSSPCVTIGSEAEKLIEPFVKM